MKTRFRYLALLIAAPLAGRAQAPAQVSRPSVSSFFTPDFQPSTAADSTALCAETIFRDSVAGFTRVYYASGRLKQYIPYADVDRRVRYGCFSTWYEDGQMCTKEDYVNGVRHGELLTYYPDGTLKRRETYINGRASIGRCYGPNGYPVPYFIYEQLPLYPGGSEQLLKELTRAVRLTPKEQAAMRSESYRVMDWLTLGWQREEEVELVVAPDGRITNARVVKSTAGFLNEAVLRAVAKLQRQFVPGRRDGQAQVSYITLPVYYTMPYQSPGANYSRNRRF